MSERRSTTPTHLHTDAVNSGTMPNSHPPPPSGAGFENPFRTSSALLGSQKSPTNKENSSSLNEPYEMKPDEQSSEMIIEGAKKAQINNLVISEPAEEPINLRESRSDRYTPSPDHRATFQGSGNNARSLTENDENGKAIFFGVSSGTTGQTSTLRNTETQRDRQAALSNPPYITVHEHTDEYRRAKERMGTVST